MSTDIFGISEITETQSSKYVTHNEAIRHIEALLAPAISKSNGGAPGSASNGDLYIVDVASGDWVDADVGDLAYYYGGSWHFYAPVNGLLKFILDEVDSVHPDGKIHYYDDESSASSAEDLWKPYEV